MKNWMKYIGKAGAGVALMFAAVMFTGCGKESDPYQKGKEVTGQLALRPNIEVNVNAQSYTSQNRTKAQNTDNYIMKVLKAGTPDVAKDVNGREIVYACSAVPEIITLPVGRYTVVACSHEPGHADWEKPYYYGLSDEFEIREATLTNAGDNITCKLSNVMVTVKYSAKFLEEMGEFEVTVSNGLGFCSFTRSETRAAYFSVAPLTVTITGKRTDGEKVEIDPIRYSNVEGGQHREITIDLELSDEIGTVGAGMSVDMTMSVIDVNENILIEEEEITDPGTDPGPTPGGEVSIAGSGFNIKNAVTYPEFNTTDVVVDIAAETGIHHLFVEIISPFLDEEELAGLGIPKIFDLCDLTPELQEAFGPGQLGLIGDDPIRGMVSMPFVITPFTGLLPVGTHIFRIEVRDEAGNSVKEDLTLKPY